MARLKDWFRRRQTGAAALLLYTLLAFAVMAPLAPQALPFTGAQDICNHVSGIVEARNALHEGQFPLRVSPRQCNNERYALSSFTATSRIRWVAPFTASARPTHTQSGKALSPAA